MNEESNPIRKSILLIAATTGYQVRVFAEAAERIGMDIVLATDRCLHLDDPWADQAIPVRFQDPFSYAESLAEAGRRVDGIAAVGDRPAFFAAIAAERLGLPFHPPAAVEACRSKYLMRERFRAAGLRVPEYRRLPLFEEPVSAARHVTYPCVLKPLGLSGSQGVIRADDPTQFVSAFQRIRAILETKDIAGLKEEQNQYVQVERYIPGREVAIEGVVTNGALQILAVFAKPDPLEGPYFAETIYVTPSREPAHVRNDLITAAHCSVEALGLTNGPVHIELRYNEEGPWILEVAGRPIGGLCARALRFDGGMPLEELILRQAAGEDVSNLRRESRASGVYMIPVPRAGVYRGAVGLERAEAVPNIEDVIITAKEGQRVQPLPEGSTYAGFIFSRAESPDLVEAALRAAHAELEFEIAATLPVMQPGA
jgi:biotin carboxylase